MSGNGGTVVNLSVHIVNATTLTMSGISSLSSDSEARLQLLRAVKRARGVWECEYIYSGNTMAITLTGGTPVKLVAQAVSRKVQAFFRGRHGFARVTVM